jgi:hypothetical protein
VFVLWGLFVSFCWKEFDWVSSIVPYFLAGLFPIVLRMLPLWNAVCSSAWSRQASRQRRLLPGPSPLPLRLQVAPL